MHEFGLGLAFSIWVYTTHCIHQFEPLIIMGRGYIYQSGSNGLIMVSVWTLGGTDGYNRWASLPRFFFFFWSSSFLTVWTFKSLSGVFVGFLVFFLLHDTTICILFPLFSTRKKIWRDKKVRTVVCILGLDARAGCAWFSLILFFVDKTVSNRGFDGLKRGFVALVEYARQSHHHKRGETG